MFKLFQAVVISSEKITFEDNNSHYFEVTLGAKETSSLEDVSSNRMSNKEFACKRKFNKDIDNSWLVRNKVGIAALTGNWIMTSSKTGEEYPVNVRVFPIVGGNIKSRSEEGYEQDMEGLSEESKKFLAGLTKPTK